MSGSGVPIARLTWICTEVIGPESDEKPMKLKALVLVAVVGKMPRDLMPGTSPGLGVWSFSSAVSIGNDEEPSLRYVPLWLTFSLNKFSNRFIPK